MAASAAQRKRDQRQRDAERLKERGAVKVPLICYRSTTACLDRLCKSAGLDTDDRYEDMITRLIHDAAEKL